jgi:hypothetical protein
MADARALVDHHLAWMTGVGRPSPQRADEQDGAAAEFLVNSTLVVVSASFEGRVEIYALEPSGTLLWDFQLAEGEELPAEQQATVVKLLDEMGSEVLFPAPAWRTVWHD